MTKATLIVALCSASVALTLSIFVYISSYSAARRDAFTHAEQQLPQSARDVAGALAFRKFQQLQGILDTALADDGRGANGAVVIDSKGELAAQSLNGIEADALTALARLAIERKEPVRGSSGILYAIPLRQASLAIKDEAQRPILGAYAVSWSDAGLAGTATDMLKRSAVWVLGVFLLALSAASFAFSRMVARPLNRVNDAMSAVAQAEYETPVPHLTRRDEIGHIATSLDSLRGALAESKAGTEMALLRAEAMQASTGAMMLTDPDYVILSVNPALVRLMQTHGAALKQNNPEFAPENLVGTRADLILPADPETQHRYKAGADGTTLVLEQQLSSGYVVVSVTPILDAEGVVVGHASEWRDITEEQGNRAVVSAIDLSQMRAEFSPAGRLLQANAQFLALLGADLAALSGHDFHNMLNAEVFAALDAGTPFTGRMQLRLPDGRAFVLSGAVSPVLDSRNRARRHVLLATDITETEAAIAAAAAQRAALAAEQQAVVEGLRAALADLSRGNLTAQITSSFAPEYEQLRQDFNAATETLKDAMARVVENAQAIRGEAGEISSAADDLSRRTEQQAATLEETAAALNELTASVQSAADVAAEANKMVENAKKNAETSGAVVREAVQAMGEIEDSSNKISKITSVIDEIAFQTNLLALNAGVEAARAGEAGRGFAVVASEVRALAQRSSDAAREIADLISASSNQVKRGVGLVGQAGESLGGIQSSVGNIYTFVSEIAVSAREQSSGLAEINVAVNQLDQVTQQNAAMFEETTAASHALTREAEALNATMGHFQIGAGAAPGSGAHSGSSSAAASRRAASAATAPVTIAAAAPAPAAAKPEAAPRRPAPAPRPAGNTAVATRADHSDDEWEDF